MLSKVLKSIPIPCISTRNIITCSPFSFVKDLLVCILFLSLEYAYIIYIKDNVLDEKLLACTLSFACSSTYLNDLAASSLMSPAAEVSGFSSLSTAYFKYLHKSTEVTGGSNNIDKTIKKLKKSANSFNESGFPHSEPEGTGFTF